MYLKIIYLQVILYLIATEYIEKLRKTKQIKEFLVSFFSEKY